jgi:hydroxypyruvate isomerase
MPEQQRFQYSLPYWCLGSTEWNWDIHRICETAKELGIYSLELVPSELLPEVKKRGLGIALASNGMPDPPFQKGLNNLRYHEEVIQRTKRAIDECVEFDIPNVIAFTGYKWTNAEDPHSGEISRNQGASNCVAGLKHLAQYAAANNVTVCLEHLNTRDGSHPMKGHPGYHGDDLDYCATIIERVGLPNVKLLFDCYHVQMMHGDLIRRIRQHGALIGHVHTAGNPGRAELDDNQEIHYPGVMRALKAAGYAGFVGHEFIPTRNPHEGLAEAIRICEA